MPSDRSRPSPETDRASGYGEGLDRLLTPRSVALIGASRRRDTLGGKILQNLLAGGFNGPVYPINPSADVVQSIRAYHSIAEVPGPVDLAIVVVPRDLVLGVIEECGEVGVGAAVLISAGFGETGEEGAQLERDVVAAARRHGIRLLGPNCMGAINTDPEVALDATFSPVPALPGVVGLVSQSGALGVAILNLAADLSLGLSSFLSIGNRADIGVVDALAWWATDERTRVVAMYLESLGEVRSFLDVARDVSRRKPIIAVKAGRSAAGARAATSHTGALATSDLAAEALLHQCGVLRAPTVQDLCHWAAAFERCPLPAGGRIAIVTNAGGPGIMAADAASAWGLELPELSGKTQRVLRAFLPEEAAVANPVDMIASATAEDYRRAVERVMADDGIDMVLVINVTPILYRPIEVVEALATLPGLREKPCLSVFMAEDAFYPEAARVPGAPPIYRFPETAVQALAALYEYAEWRARPAEGFESVEVDREGARALLARLAAERNAGEGRDGQPFLIPYGAATDLLVAYGISVPAQAVVSTSVEAAEAAVRIGGKVALKALGADLLHKSDVGGVALHLQGAAEVLARAQSMEESVARHDQHLSGYLVQAMTPGGTELIVGARRDPVWGALLMVGLGGLFAEALKDVQLRLLPITAADAREMLEALKAYPLLAGKERGPGVHLDTVVDLLGRVARMMEDHPSLCEVELNPVICGPLAGECQAVDAVLRIGEAGV